MKLKYNEIKKYRDVFLNEQENKCAICGHIIQPGQEVLDHCHKSGRIRGVLHRSCNSVLGKIENSATRFGLRELYDFCNNVGKYIKNGGSDVILQHEELIHPTYKDKGTKPKIPKTTPKKQNELKG